MAAKTPGSLDGTEEPQTVPYVPVRGTFQTDTERAQSGGLDDDPTDSGDPVKNRRSFTNLTGGR